MWYTYYCADARSAKYIFAIRESKGFHLTLASNSISEREVHIVPHGKPNFGKGGGVQSQGWSR